VPVFFLSIWMCSVRTFALLAVVCLFPAAALANDPQPAPEAEQSAPTVERNDLKDPFAGLPETPANEKKQKKADDSSFEVETNDLAKPFER
jgi:hypothetical protein